MTSRSRPGSEARLRLAALAVAVLPLAAPLAAQQAAETASQNPLLEVPAPFLTVDQERLFTDSAFGLRVASDFEARSRALSEENGRIQAELVAEEQALTDQRPELAPEEFRTRADAFDEKVQRIRAEQDAKSRELVGFREAEQQRFAAQLGGVLAEIARARGALAIMDRRTMLVSADSIDVTDVAIAAMNARLGDGADTTPKE